MARLETPSGLRGYYMAFRFKKPDRIVINVYRDPNDSKIHRLLEQAIAETRQRFPSDTLYIGGDWNAVLEGSERLNKEMTAGDKKWAEWV